MTASAASLAVLCGCSGGVLDPKGPVGAAQRTLIFNSLTIMLAIVVPVIVLTAVFAWWFRASNRRARHLPTWAYSGRLELLVWSIPTLAVLFLGGIGWIGSHSLDPFLPPSQLIDSAKRANGDNAPASRQVLEVQVVSLDWKWLFIYPEQNIATVNQLVIPAGIPVHFRLTSATVMNSFFVPQLGSQIYTMAGMTSQLTLLADDPGKFFGLSAQFSGDGFSDMVFGVESLPRGEFESWVKRIQSADGSQALDERAYVKLAEPGTVAKPLSWRSVAPDLFDHIVATPAGIGNARSAGVKAAFSTATGPSDPANRCVAPREVASESPGSSPDASFPGPIPGTPAPPLPLVSTPARKS